VIDHASDALDVSTASSSFAVTAQLSFPIIIPRSRFSRVHDCPRASEARSHVLRFGHDSTALDDSLTSNSRPSADARRRPGRAATVLQLRPDRTITKHRFSSTHDSSTSGRVRVVGFSTQPALCASSSGTRSAGHRRNACTNHGNGLRCHPSERPFLILRFWQRRLLRIRDSGLTGVASTRTLFGGIGWVLVVLARSSKVSPWLVALRCEQDLG
jgi:hypothetical protein